MLQFLLGYIRNRCNVPVWNCPLPKGVGWNIVRFISVLVTDLDMCKAVTGLDMESAHPLQLREVSFFTRMGGCLFVTSYRQYNQSVTPRYKAVQQLHFMVLSCKGWADSLSNPVTAFLDRLNFGTTKLCRNLKMWDRSNPATYHNPIHITEVLCTFQLVQLVEFTIYGKVYR